MGHIWTDKAKYQTWLDVELAACEANFQLGRIPKAAIEQIRQKASFEPKRILEIELEVKHDVIAFLTNINEHVGDAGRYIHVGMTSSDGYARDEGEVVGEYGVGLRYLISKPLKMQGGFDVAWGPSKQPFIYFQFGTAWILRALM